MGAGGNVDAGLRHGAKEKRHQLLAGAVGRRVKAVRRLTRIKKPRHQRERRIVFIDQPVDRRPGGARHRQRHRRVGLALGFGHEIGGKAFGRIIDPRLFLQARSGGRDQRRR